MPEIQGYRALSEEELATINQIKSIGHELQVLVHILSSKPSFDQRWVSIGSTDLQTGLMALVRAVARPTTFA